jgi:iron complex outermembrane recepter protein
VSFRASVDITKDIDLDGWLRFASEVQGSGAVIPALPSPSTTVPSYVTLDLRLAWRPIKDLELAVVGQNLVGSPHREFNPTFVSTQYTEVGRSVYGKITWRF